MKRTQNIEIAQSLMYFDKSIAIMRCGASENNAIALADIFRRKGWFVYEIAPEEFMERGGDRVASVLVICDAATLPRKLSPYLEKYSNENGRIFIIGGPLFGYKDITEKDMILEGICPLYKTFIEDKCEVFENSSPFITEKKLSGMASKAILPNARPNGEGYNNNRRCRILPILTVKKDGGRDDGRRGSAAYFVLTDTIGHMVNTPGTRLGNVSPITQGSEMAVIGISLDELLKMNGEDVIVDMMTALDLGLFLFEGGSENYVVKPYEKIAVGAKIMSASRDYIDVTVRFSVGDMVKEKNVLTFGQNFTSVAEEFDGIGDGEYTVCTELICRGRIIDKVENTLFVTNGIHSADKNDFVTVSDGNFKLHGENWYMYGMNYFPLYHVSLEINDYWRGVFDKSNYIPSEVDKDLKHISSLGMNCVAIRIDSNALENIIDPLKDFFCRCAKYDLKVMMSFCNITNPLYFNEKAFAEFIEMLGVSDDPTLFAHDIFWESGGGFVGVFNSRKFAGEWRDWLIERYGSIAVAEESFGVTLDRTVAGDVICPYSEHFYKRDMECRLMMTAFTRFLTEMAGRKWNDAIRAMKKYDNNHLYTNRIGHLDDTTPNIFLSAVAKHLDFMCLEAYSITLDDTGFLASVALDRAAHCVSGGKPVTWVEYGISLPGMSGLAFGSKPYWDGEKNAPLAWRLEEQQQYQEQFNQLFKMCNDKGSMPWFYAGGFRYTEFSDCGYAAPNGENRPSMEAYADIGQWFVGERKEPRVTEFVEADPDGEISHWCRFVYGEGVYSKFAFDHARLIEGKPLEDTRVWGKGIEAADRARSVGGIFEFVLKGSNTTSIDTPLIVCGDEDYRGIGVLKYLDSEFNYVKISNGKEDIMLERGKEVKLPAGTYSIEASVGNIAAAKWIAGNHYGCAALKCNDICLAMDKDTDYLEDAIFSGTININEGQEIVMRLTSLSRADFGEFFKFNVKVI